MVYLFSFSVLLACAAFYFCSRLYAMVLKLSHQLILLHDQIVEQTNQHDHFTTTNKFDAHIWGMAQKELNAKVLQLESRLNGLSMQMNNWARMVSNNGK